MASVLIGTLACSHPSCVVASIPCRLVPHMANVTPSDKVRVESLHHVPESVPFVGSRHDDARPGGAKLARHPMCA